MFNKLNDNVENCKRYWKLWNILVEFIEMKKSKNLIDGIIN